MNAHVFDGCIPPACESMHAAPCERRPGNAKSSASRVVLALVLFALGSTPNAHATASAVAGSARGAGAELLALGVGPNEVGGAAPPGPGFAASASFPGITAGVPILAPDLLSTGMVTVSTEGGLAAGSVNSRADVDNLAVGVSGVIALTANSVDVTATASCASGAPMFAGTTVIGGPSLSVLGIPITVPGTPAPNLSLVDVSAVLASVRVILNAQSNPDPNTIAVTGIVVEINTLSGLNVRLNIGTARATVGGCGPTVTSPVNGATLGDSTPTFAGLGRTGATIDVRNDSGNVVCTTTVAAGTWACTPVTPFAEGPQTLRVTQTVGMETSAARAVSVTIDTTAPNAPNVTSPAGGSIIATVLPTFAGTGEAGATVQVTVNGAPACTATVSPGGNWSCAATATIPNGPANYAAVQRDLAGNTSQPATGQFTIDTIAPAAPVVVHPADGSSVGTSTPTFSGSGEPGATVRVVINGGLACSATAGPTGNWSCIVAPPLADGNASYTASQTDGAGNQGPSAAGRFVVDTTDADADGIAGGSDNCPLNPNPGQTDTDGDGSGDACDSDDDNDGYTDGRDNCPVNANASQLDTDGDSLGDACDPDIDNDGVSNGVDNCPLVRNPTQDPAACAGDADGDGIGNGTDNCPSVWNRDQSDIDADGVGDACDTDIDGDNVANPIDNCPLVPNPAQNASACAGDADGDGTPDGSDSCPFNPDPACIGDGDGDGIPDDIDTCPLVPNPGNSPAVCAGDDDGDGVANGLDNCPSIANPLQTDANGNGIGDACEPDGDGDGVPDAFDNCPAIWNANQSDNDGDGIGDACDSDDDTADGDGDGIGDDQDNCPLISNPSQQDTDRDGIGDACDGDLDGDGLPDFGDNCPLSSNPNQADSDGDGIGDVCDADDDNDGNPDPVDDCPFDPDPTCRGGRIFGDGFDA